MARFSEALAQWVDAGLGLIYPEICQICQEARATPAQSFLCDTCRAKVKFVRPPFCSRCGLPYAGQITQAFECANCREMDFEFEFARSAVLAQDLVLEVVHRYKYNRGVWFEPLLAGWLIAEAKAEVDRERWDCIVPVPLHSSKEREREFNQAERLARRLSQAVGIPLDTHCVRRVRATETQTRLSREERHKNMRQAFAPAPGRRLSGARVILVDDVMTTGATTNACAKALRLAGAAQVCVWTVVRGI